MTSTACRAPRCAQRSYINHILAHHAPFLSGRFHRQVCRPEVTDTPEAPRTANEELAAMGPTSRDPRTMPGAAESLLSMCFL